MSTLLASADDLYDSTADAAAFNESRRLAALGTLVDEVPEHFKLRDVDWNTLLQYVVRHPEVIDVIAEAPVAIRRIFGPVRPFLDLVRDPEEGWESLFIAVPTNEPARQALNRLQALDAQWFGDAARRSGFALIVTIETDV